MPDAPAILLVQSDPVLRASLAAGLRQDGMKVVEYAAAEMALGALGRGLKASVLVTEPALGRLTEQELAEQARDAAPHLEVILTRPDEANDLAAPSGAHVIATPLEPRKLSKFIRLIAAGPVLQRQFRQAETCMLDANVATQ